ncbi:MAG: hypothetical protein AAFR65_14870 [Pseudomonadota bacterium]
MRHDLGDRVFRLIDASTWAPSLAKPFNIAGILPCKPQVIPELETDDGLADLIDELELTADVIDVDGFDFSISAIATAYSPGAHGVVHSLATIGGERAADLGMRAVETVWHPGPQDNGPSRSLMPNMVAADPVPVPPAAPIFVGGFGAFVLSRHRPQRRGPARAIRSRSADRGPDQAKPVRRPSATIAKVRPLR